MPGDGSKPIRVLLRGRSKASLREGGGGGDQVQIEKTAEALRAIGGIEPVVGAEDPAEIAGFDLVHLFNLTRPQDTWPFATAAQRMGIPVVLSTVFVETAGFESTGRRGVGHLMRMIGADRTETLKAVGRAVLRGERGPGLRATIVKGFEATQNEVLSATEMLLPNSRSELARVVSRFPSAHGIASAVVPNGVDADFFDPSLVPSDDIPDWIRELEGCILCVGRIEHRKNQLGLVNALRGSTRTIVLAGPPAPNQPGYERQIRSAGIDGVRLIGEVDVVTARQLFSVAAVHVLPSWFETTGLSSLEAAAMGCPIVVSPFGDTGDYFSGIAEFCEPGDPESIRRAVEAAIRKGRDPDLRGHITSNYTWQRAAEATADAYFTVLGASPVS